MMYSEMLAVAIKNNGKVLREFKDTVYVPFGSEYSIFIKNLNSVRCLVNIQIDGSDVADGEQFVVPARGEVNIERYLKNGNLANGNRFKFIERTSKIEEHRGVEIEDGLIRIEFEFERLPVAMSSGWYTQYPPGVRHPWSTTPYFDTLQFGSVCGSNGAHDLLARGMEPTFSADASQPVESLNKNVLRSRQLINQVTAQSNTISDVGITVPGSVSDQKFTKASGFSTDGVKHVMVLKLLGEFGQQKVEKPITVKTKPTCSSCGKVNKATAKFCSECGTGLLLV